MFDQGSNLRESHLVDTTVFGLFVDDGDVENAINELLDAGFPSDEIARQKTVVAGESLLTVHGPMGTRSTGPLDWVNTAKDILDRCGAESVAAASEAGSTINRRIL